MDEKWPVRVKNEFKKIAAMPFREKREYIWEYYKVSIMITAFLLFIMGSLINTWFINPPKDEFLVVAWSGGYESPENMESLAQELNVLVNDPESEAVTVTSFIPNGDPTYDMALGQRMIAMISVGGLDVFVSDAESIEGLAQQSLIQPIEGLIETAYGVDPSLREKLAGKFIEASYVPVEDDTVAPTPRVFGVNLNQCPMFERLGLYEQDVYLCLCVTTEKMDTIARALSLLYA